jgi:hypothetical protein
MRLIAHRCKIDAACTLLSTDVHGIGGVRSDDRRAVPDRTGSAAAADESGGQ